jgi:small redox-active disulfide protein 2
LFYLWLLSAYLFLFFDKDAKVKKICNLKNFHTFVRKFTKYEYKKQIVMEIKILGTGCPNCKSLEKVTREAVESLGINADISKVEDIMKIMEYGVMRTPGLVVNNKVVLSGKVPDKAEIQQILSGVL